MQFWYFLFKYYVIINGETKEITNENWGTFDNCTDDHQLRTPFEFSSCDHAMTKSLGWRITNLTKYFWRDSARSGTRYDDSEI